MRVTIDLRDAMELEADTLQRMVAEQVVKATDRHAQKLEWQIARMNAELRELPFVKARAESIAKGGFGNQGSNEWSNARP